MFLCGVASLSAYPFKPFCGNSLYALSPCVEDFFRAIIEQFHEFVPVPKPAKSTISMTRANALILGGLADG
jgi:hypothetical protein